MWIEYDAENARWAVNSAHVTQVREDPGLGTLRCWIQVLGDPEWIMVGMPYVEMIDALREE